MFSIDDMLHTAKDCMRMIFKCEVGALHALACISFKWNFAITIPAFSDWRHDAVPSCPIFL